MADFAKAMTEVFRWEKWYSNDPHDLGGETYVGIARKFHPDWEGWVIIDRAKEDHLLPLTYTLPKIPELLSAVKTFYYDRYWTRYRLVYLHDQTLANKVLVCLTNSERGGSMALQNAINALGGAVSVDGMIGPLTISAANVLDPDTLLLALKVMMGMHHLSQDTEQKDRYLLRWLRRDLA